MPDRSDPLYDDPGTSSAAEAPGPIDTRASNTAPTPRPLTGPATPANPTNQASPATPKTATNQAPHTTPGLPAYDELAGLADKGELTEETLQEKLAAYRSAFQQEYEVATETEPDRVPEETLNYFKKETPGAAAQIVWLAYNAESESVRKDMLKYIVEKGLITMEEEADPLQDLINGLNKPKTAAKPANVKTAGE